MKRETEPNYAGLRPGFFARLRTFGPFRAQDGFFLGVAKGLAEHFGWPTGLVRLIFVLAAILLFFWPTLVLYLGAALLMSPAPTGLLENPAERDVWLQAQLDPQAAMNSLSRRAESLEKRLRRLEDFVTSRDYAWLRRLKNNT
jgi:phage shock protein C